MFKIGCPCRRTLLDTKLSPFANRWNDRLRAFDFSGGFLAHASPKRRSAKKRWADGGLFRADFFVPSAEFCMFPFSKKRRTGIFRGEPVFLPQNGHWEKFLMATIRNFWMQKTEIQYNKYH
jgi:hypothetical protein